MDDGHAIDDKLKVLELLLERSSTHSHRVSKCQGRFAYCDYTVCVGFFRSLRAHDGLSLSF